SYKVNYAHLVPPILLLLVKSPIVKEYDLSSLRMVTSSAAPLSTRLVTDIFEIYNIHVKQGYGLTEASPLITLVDEKNIVQGIMRFDILKAKIISEDGKELGCNEPGELCIRGPNVMKGYLNNKEATDSSFDKDGFFHTGDVVTIDSQGNLFIVDRVKELIKYK
ncbi:13406_t:CDS:2, partial [Acaulospora morrowiae]